MLIEINIATVKDIRNSIDSGNVKIKTLNNFLKLIEFQIENGESGSDKSSIKKPRKNLKRDRIEACKEYYMKTIK